MDEQEDDITRRVNGFIDAFIDRGECNFTEEFAELFPSSVFLGLMGLPEDELRMFLDLRDGILHPEKCDPNAMFDVDARRGGDGRRPARRSTSTSATSSTNAPRAADRRHPHALRRRPRSTASKLTREDILDICFLFLIAGLDTVSDTLTCSYAFLAHAPRAPPDDRRRPVDHPASRSRSCCGGSRRSPTACRGSRQCPVDLPERRTRRARAPR